MKTYKQMQDRLKWYPGRYIDFDGAYQAQCMDLAVDFIWWATDGKYRMWGNAIDAINDRVNNYGKFATIHKNTKNFLPEVGDIAVWTKAPAHEVYGHIGIVYGNISLSTCTMLDQNWDGDPSRPAKLRTDDYRGVTHFIRINFEGEKLPAPATPVGKKDNGKVIALDIGHGVNTFPSQGKGVFKNGKGYAEFSFNNALAKKIKKLLEHNGFDVIMAQPFNGNDVDLVKRTNYYDSKRPDLGLSIHANAGNSAVQGRCAFYWFTSKQGKSFADSIVDNMKDKGYSSHGVGLHASEWGSWTNLHMVRMSMTFPMVLVEHGFMTNNFDFNLIFGNGQDKYINDMAIADAKAVCDYFGYGFAEIDETTLPNESVSDDGEFFRVQIGAFSKKANATNLRNKVNAKGYETLLAYDNDDDLYRVQVGAFSKKSNANNQLKKLKADGFKDAFIAGNDGHVVSFETTAPGEKLTPYTIGDWDENQFGTQYIQAKGTFTVGPTRIMSTEGSPFDSSPLGGYAYPGYSIDYDELVRVKEGPRKGHVEIGYNQNGKRWYLPYNTWDPLTGDVGPEEWGTFS